MTNLTDPRAKHVPELWSHPIEEWSRWLAASGRTRSTINTRTDHLRRAARELQGSPWEVSDQRLIEWVGRKNWSLETRRSVYASLRLFWEWGTGTGAATASPASLPRVRASHACPRPCPEAVIDAAKATADPRIRLMIRLGAELGLRRGEIARVHESDLYQATEGWVLRVFGKGERLRILPATEDLALAIRVECRRGAGFAFPGQIDGQLSAAYVGKLLAAHLPGEWTGHTLRHRFGTVTFAKSQDVMAVSRLLGHSSVGTTQIYVATDAKRLREVAATAA